MWRCTAQCNALRWVCARRSATRGRSATQLYVCERVYDEPHPSRVRVPSESGSAGELWVWRASNVVRVAGASGSAARARPDGGRTRRHSHRIGKGILYHWLSAPHVYFNLYFAQQHVGQVARRPLSHTTPPRCSIASRQNSLLVCRESQRISRHWRVLRDGIRSAWRPAAWACRPASGAAPVMRVTNARRV